MPNWLTLIIRFGFPLLTKLMDLAMAAAEIRKVQTQTANWKKTIFAADLIRHIEESVEIAEGVSGFDKNPTLKRDFVASQAIDFIVEAYPDVPVREVVSISTINTLIEHAYKRKKIKEEV